MRYILFLLALVAVAFGQTAPSIAAITNAAIPALDAHLPTRVKPRSLATIFGNNLATSAVSTVPPWQKSLGGTEVHLVPLFTGCGTANPPAGLSCELIADLLYVSPTQINFLVPDVSAAAYGQSELLLKVVLVRDGLRFDGLLSFYLTPVGDFVLFQVGFDCEFSLSLAHPETCGYSLSPGNNRVPLGAVTDASGRLVTSQNPLHQGEPISLWATGIGLLTLNPTSSLLEQSKPAKITFGIMQPGLSKLNWTSPTPSWAGESPQFVGLDQINIVVPPCTGSAATSEQRYELFINFQAPSADKNLGIGFAELNIPFIVSPGEPTCQF
jgi:hypothetical protein